MGADQFQEGLANRFEFGKNWQKLLPLVDDERVQLAEQSLSTLGNVAGKTFLDIGSGSGLFSLAARRLGAIVRSFDYDPASVACTAELKRRFFAGDPQWIVEQGSVLDTTHLSRLGQFDVVYSWGVLHHTGNMRQALENVIPLVKPGGQLFIAIYNDQGRATRIWKKIKRCYVQLPAKLRFIILWPVFAWLWGPLLVRDSLAFEFGRTWREYRGRGMAPWSDVVDWVGGYPFETAKPEEIFALYRQRGFRLEHLMTQGGGIGCNQFIFTRDGQDGIETQST